MPPRARAVQSGRRLPAKLDALDGGAGTGHLYRNATIALILLDRLDEALAAVRTAHARLLREGDECQLLAAVRGRLADAARLIGHDDAVLERTGNGVRPLAALVRARREPTLAAALPAPELARLRMEGAAMRDEQAFQLGFSAGA